MFFEHILKLSQFGITFADVNGSRSGEMVYYKLNRSRTTYFRHFRHFRHLRHSFL
jgi:hypothetical protein